MSRLIIVRHAQASFLEDDYDKLSTRGEEQARRLGDYFAQAELRPDHIYTGPRRRQQDTARIVAGQTAAAGLPWPDATPIPEWDECAGEEVLRRYTPQLIMTDETIRGLANACATLAGDGLPARTKAFQRLAYAIMTRWVQGKLETPDLETWNLFGRRIAGQIRHIQQAHHGGQTIIVFTSGGASAAVMQYALRTSPEKTLGFMWAKRNCALSEFLFTGQRFSLSAFNTTPHLPNPELWTYV